MIKCKYCGDTGKIALITSVVDCDCLTQRDSPSGPQSFPEGSNLRNAWYSEETARKYGTCVYLDTKTRQEVTITEVSRKSTPCGRWKDMKFVGVVDKYVRGVIK